MNFSMKKAVPFSVMSLLVFFTGLWAVGAVAQETPDPLLARPQLSVYEWSVGQGGDLKIELELPPEYHAYEDKFQLEVVSPEGFKVTQPKIAPLVEWFDKYSKRNRTGIKGQAVLSAAIEAPAAFTTPAEVLSLTLTYQACTPQFCLFPTIKNIEIPIKLIGYEAASHTQSKGIHSEQDLLSYLDQGLLTALFFIFIAGIVTSFTPCIFPMIPITLAVLGNHAQQRSRLQNFITSLFYVLGISTTYSLLGVAAASSGSMFGASLGNPYVLALICSLFLLMALGMYGLYDLQMPAFIRNRLGNAKTSPGFSGAFLSGLLAGIVASPCVGPVLVAILTYVASTQDHLKGFLLLFTYAWGLGLIFIVLGLFSELTKKLPRSGPWMNFSKFLLGTLMLSAFFYYLELLLPSRFFDAALGVGLISLASIYGAFIPNQGISALRRLQKGFMQALLVVGSASLIIAAFDLRPLIRNSNFSADSLNQAQKLNWQSFSQEALQDAFTQNKPVIVDFWADWCAACHELEQNTFTDLRVRAMAENFILLKFDATKDSALLKELKNKYNIQGLPTLLFFSREGDWLKEQTLTQFEKSDSFLKRMEWVYNYKK